MNQETHKTLAQIARGIITRKAAARLLKVSTRTINRIMIKAGVRRPDGEASRKHKQVQLRNRTRALVIQATIAEPAEVPANLLDISERTVYRLRRRYQNG